MKVIALIPARYDSTRFPGKLMGLLGNKTVIRTTYENAVKLKIFDEVYVVTDSPVIFDEIVTNGGKAIKSVGKHNTGSDRIAEAAHTLQADVILNIQGDEPFISKEPMEKLISSFENPMVDVATLIQELKDTELINDPNYVKVVMDKDNFALYFSRATIPFNRDNNKAVKYYEHIGVYAYKKEALIKFSSLSQTPLEDIEKIEPIRLLENGMKIKMIETEYMGIEIDTEEDLIRANKFLKSRKGKI